MDMPSSSVYLFSEKGRNLYVGRSNRFNHHHHHPVTVIKMLSL